MRRTHAPQLLFTSQGKTARINIDGTSLRFFDFSVPNQVTWQPGPVFPDGRRLVFLSMEPRRDGPGKSFDEFYTQTPTHIWVHDLVGGDLKEICTQNRLAAFVTPALLLDHDRMLIQVVRDRVGQIYNVRLDGSDARAFTQAGEGLPYGLSLSPDGQRVAFHLASPKGYQVWTSDLDGGHASSLPETQNIFILARVGHRMASGSCTLIATIAKIQVTIGRMYVLARPTVRCIAF